MRIHRARSTKQIFYNALKERKSQVDEMQSLASAVHREDATKKFYTAQETLEKANRNYEYHRQRSLSQMEDIVKVRLFTLK